MKHETCSCDFNCDPGSRFYYHEFAYFALEDNLVMSDILRLNNAVTYTSNDCSKSSWMYHVLNSVEADNMIFNMCILNDVTVSDHRPVSFCLQCNI